MALQRTVDSQVRWETRRSAPPRLPLSAVVPSFDVTMLGASLLAGHEAGRLRLLYLAIAFGVLAGSGSQRARINPRLSDEVLPMLASLAVPLVAAAPLVGSDSELGRLAKVAFVATLLVVVGRTCAYHLIRTARARGMVVEPTVIIGARAVGIRVARTLRDHPEFGLVPIGFLDAPQDRTFPLPILGSAEQLEAVVREFQVKRVIVAFGAARESDMVRIVRACDRLPVEMYVLPRFFEL